MAVRDAFAAKFRIDDPKAFKLAKYDPRDQGGFSDKDKTKTDTADVAHEINVLQDKLYAEGKRALLVIFQGIDGSGKDGTTRVVFDACTPMGLQITSFKAPSREDLSHDYLWRVHKACPEKGMIGIFNRSHYEDVLVVKVEKFAPVDVIEKRYEQINQFEKMLSDSGTRILKFMLNVSKKEQAQRLQERVDTPEKQWKFNPSDLTTRAKWDDYMAAYETLIQRCSTEYAQWHVIPADRNWVRNAIVARIVQEALVEMNPKYPGPVGWDPKTIKID